MMDECGLNLLQVILSVLIFLNLFLKLDGQLGR